MSGAATAGRVALITGAAQGIGFAVARRLAEDDVTVVLNDLSAERLGAAQEKLEQAGATVVAMVGDVTDHSAVAHMIDDVMDSYGRIDVLVNNAGMLMPTPFSDITEDEWDAVVDVSLKGTFLCCQAVVRHMIDRGWGRIVNLSSTAGKNVSTMGGAHYTAAKAAVLGLTRHLANEVAAHGITVNAVCPGLIDTEMTRGTITPEQSEAYAASFPIKRLGGPEEVAELIVFLASDRAAYITGAAVDINGGDLMV